MKRWRVNNSILNKLQSNIFLGIAIAVVITFAWRLLGMLSVGKLESNHPLVLWATSVAFASVSALTVKLIIFPVNEALLQTPMSFRLVAVVITIAVFFMLKRSFITATLFGMTVLYILLRM